MVRADSRASPWFENPLVALAAVALAGLFLIGKMRLHMPTSVCLALLCALVFFCLSFRRPVWAIAALIVIQVAASGYMLYPTSGSGISVNLLWVLATILLMIPIIAQSGLSLGSKSRGVIIPAIVFLAIATIANVLNTDIAQAFQYIRWSFTALAIIILLPTMVRREKDLKLVGTIALITCSISAIAAVIQYMHPSSINWARPGGLSGSPIQLAASLSVLLIPAISLLILRATSPWVRRLLILAVFIMGVGLILTFTRSGLYSLAVAIPALALLLSGKTRYQLLLVTLICVVVFISYSFLHGGRLSEVSDTSALTRPVLWEAGVDVALDHPLFGIGEYRFPEVSATYASRIDPRLMEDQGAGTVLGQLMPHNDFIMVWASFGTPALIAFIWLLVSIFRNFIYSHRHAKSPFIKSLAVGCACAVLAYVVNMSFHNILDSVFILWVLGGLSIVCANLALHESSSTPEKPRC